jgi:hypothetical protein
LHPRVIARNEVQFSRYAQKEISTHVAPRSPGTQASNHWHPSRGIGR